MLRLYWPGFTDGAFVSVGDTRIDVVEGVDENDRQYECYDVMLEHLREGALGCAVLHPNLVLAATKPLSKAQWTGVEFELLGFDEWVSAPVFDVRADVANVAIAAPHRQSTRFTLDATMNWGVVVDVSSHLPGHTSNRVEMLRRTWCGFYGIRTKSIDELLPMGTAIESLFMLLTGQPTTALNVRLVSSPEMRADVYYAPVVRDISGISPRRAHNRRISFAAVEPVIEDVVARWYANRGYLQPVYDLYHYVAADSGRYTPNRFLNLVQACEALHQRCPVRRLGNADLRTGVSGRDLGLGDCLEDLVGTAPEILVQAMGTDFVANVVNTRNYYTHYNPGKPLQVPFPSPHEGVEAMQRLQLILEVGLLLSAGVPMDMLENGFRRDPLYRSLCQG